MLHTNLVLIFLILFIYLSFLSYFLIFTICLDFMLQINNIALSICNSGTS